MCGKWKKSCWFLLSWKKWVVSHTWGHTNPRCKVARATHFLWWCLVFVGPHYGTGLKCLEFLGGYYGLGNLWTPAYVNNQDN